MLDETLGYSRYRLSVPGDPPLSSDVLVGPCNILRKAGLASRCWQSVRKVSVGLLARESHFANLRASVSGYSGMRSILRAGDF